MTFFCHQCRRHIMNTDENFKCPHCKSGFVEEVPSHDGSFDDSSTDEPGAEGPQPSGDGRTLVFRRVSSGDDQHPPMYGIMSGGTSPLGQIFQHIFGVPTTFHQQQQSQQRPTSSASATATEGPQDFGQFLNLLLSNLAEGGGTGGNISFTFGGGNGGSEGGEGRIPFFQRLHGNFGDYAWGEGGLDQIATFLLNQFDQSQQESLRPEELERLPMTWVTPVQVENGVQCTTCMETFSGNEEVAKLNCDHIFHRDCIVPWLTKRNTCPICRKVIDPKDWKKSPASSSASTSNGGDGGRGGTGSKTNNIIDIDDLD